MIPYITTIIQQYMYSNTFVMCEYKKRVVYMDFLPCDGRIPYTHVKNKFGSVSRYNWRMLNIMKYFGIYRTSTLNGHRDHVANLSCNYCWVFNIM